MGVRGRSDASCIAAVRSKLVATTATLLLLSSACASSGPNASRFEPTEKRPIRGCLITCPDGFSIRLAHICRSTKRWFETIIIYAARVERSADGSVLLAYWIGRGERDAPDWRQDYDQRDVVLRDCSEITTAVTAETVDRGAPEPVRVPWR